MNRAALTSSLVLAGLMASAGCHSTPGGPPSSPPPPTSQPAVQAPSSGNASTPGLPPVTAPPMLPDKDMTHKVTADAPYFDSMPATLDVKPTGMLKAGSKVLVLVPGATLSKVTTQDGKDVYTKTEDLDPLGK